MSEVGVFASKIDMHVHSIYSSDSANRPEDIVRAARRRGLKGFAVTDHDTIKGIPSFKGIADLIVVPGVEITTDAGHLLGLGIEECPRKGIELLEALDFIRERGGLSVAAHPFSGGKAAIGQSLLSGVAVDAVEVFNASNWFPGANRKAASLRPRAKTGGSDAHFPWEVGSGYTMGPGIEEAQSAEEVLAAVRKGRTEGAGERLSLAMRLAGKVALDLGLFKR